MILLKSGISYTSLKNAEENLAAEMKDFDFDRTHAECVRLWNDELAKVSVEGGTDEEKRVFYTALYHTLIDPRLCSDINGEYTGADKKIHQTGKFRKRTIFSGWDVFRSQMPLQTIINPEMVNDLVNSLVEIADQSGNEYLERWELLNAYSGCMVGNPAISVLCDAYRKGIRDYDVEKAYRYALNTSRRFSNNDDAIRPAIYPARWNTIIRIGAWPVWPSGWGKRATGLILTSVPCRMQLSSILNRDGSVRVMRKASFLLCLKKDVCKRAMAAWNPILTSKDGSCHTMSRG